MEAYRYGRVSKEDREDPERSIQNQDADTLNYCNKLGYLDKGYTFDKNISGSATTRPALDKLKQKAESGEKFEIIITRADRLGRGNALQELLDLFRLEYQIEVISIAQDIRDEIQTDSTAYSSGHAVTIARYNFRIMVERKKKDGLAFFTPPFGYSYNNKKEWIIDRQKAEIVRKAYNMVLQGADYKRVCTELGLSSKQYYKVIADKNYTGLVHYNNHVRRKNTKAIIRIEKIEYQGKHTPIITKEMFEQVQQKLIKPQKIPKYLQRG